MSIGRTGSIAALVAAAVALGGAGATAPAHAWGEKPDGSKPAQQTPEQVRAARAAKEAAWAKAAAGRTDFQIRGLKLGMTLPELESKLGGEIVEIEPRRKPDWRLPAFSQYPERLRLSDGTRVSVTFSSPMTGSIAGTVMVEQTLRDGPAPEALLADLVKRYGETDERGASGWWLTWHLKSRVPVPDGLGSFLKVHFRTGKDGKVDYFRAVLNDYKFMMQDEQNAAGARRESERQEYERQRSGTVKF